MPPSSRLTQSPRNSADIGSASVQVWLLWLFWLLFVVYGSLVPLDFHPIPWAQAWQRLIDAPMLKLGIESRADWVANGVLYLPIGFLGVVALLPSRAGLARRLVAALVAVLVGGMLAAAVELAQTAFPHRTVSRNDLLAEAIGTLLGALAAVVDRGRFRALLWGWTQGGGTLARQLGWFYAAVFPLLTLFPFDLLLSAAEWQTKLDGPLVGWMLADSSLNLGLVRLAAKMLFETMAVAPLGALWVSRPARQFGPLPWKAALARGALLGILVEVAQLAIASGQSQGLSVLTRMLGFALGTAAWAWQQTVSVEDLRASVRRRSSPMLLVLVAGWVVLGGAWRGPWLDTAQGWWRLTEEVHFQPFYYHYFTTEMQALVSLLAIAGVHAPLGLLGWAWHVRTGITVLMAALLAALLEAAKSWSSVSHSDPTNVLVAAAAAGLGQMLVARLFQPLVPGHRT